MLIDALNKVIQKISKTKKLVFLQPYQRHVFFEPTTRTWYGENMEEIWTKPGHQ